MKYALLWGYLVRRKRMDRITRQEEQENLESIFKGLTLTKSLVILSAILLTCRTSKDSFARREFVMIVGDLIQVRDRIPATILMLEGTLTWMLRWRRLEERTWIWEIWVWRWMNILIQWITLLALILLEWVRMLFLSFLRSWGFWGETWVSRGREL